MKLITIRSIISLSHIAAFSKGLSSAESDDFQNGHVYTKHVRKSLTSSVMFLAQNLTIPSPFQWESLNKQVSRVTDSKWFGQEDRGISDRLEGPLAGIKCDGSFCEELKLRSYRHMRRGSEEMFVGPPTWTPWFNSQNESFTKCPENMLVSRMQCKQRSCDSMRLQCRKMKPGYRIKQSNKLRTKWITEQKGIQSCKDGYFVQGMKSKGQYSRKVRLLCAQVQYEQLVIGDFHLKDQQDVCNDVTINGNKEWIDAEGRNCDWYADNNHCETWGSDEIFKNSDHVASTACCACGGGSLFES